MAHFLDENGGAVLAHALQKGLRRVTVA